MNKLLHSLTALLMLTTSAIARGSLDTYVDTSLKDSEIKASPICSDEVYLRRTYLTLAGKLPTLEQSIEFIDTKSKKRRAKLIDQLIESEDFVETLCLKWGDLLKIKSEFPSNIWPNGVQAYNRWVKEHMRANTPYDDFVRDLLISTGSNFRSPQVSFYRAFVQRTPEVIADNVELLFLGRRQAQPAAKEFFTQVRYKATGEWKEEIVYVDLDTKIPYQNEVRMDDGELLHLVQNSDSRKIYVDWLTSDQNRAFARAYANRVWYWIMGRGIIHEPDDIRADNPASNPELLEYLADELVESGYDTRELIRLIMNSKTYQCSSIATDENQDKGASLFAYYPTIRLTSEQIIDGISLLTGINDRYMSRVPEPYSYYPADLTSRQIGDATVSSPQLDLFGRPSRDYSLENQRSNEINSKQTLYLLNSNAIMHKIESSKRIGDIVEGCKSRGEVVEKVYLMMLSRRATKTEQEQILGKFEANSSNRDIANKLVWALLNSSEFLFNH